MPVYSVQGPGGKVYDVQGPEGATADQLGSFIMQNASSFNAGQTAQPDNVSAPPDGYKVTITGTRDNHPNDDGTQPDTQNQPGAFASLAAGLGHGVGALALGGQQLLGHGLDAVGLGGAGNWLIDDARRGLSKIDAENATYKTAHGIVNRVGDFGGQVGITLPALPLSLAARAGLLGRAGIAAAEGGALSALNPVTDDSNFAAEKTKQALLGAAAGGLLAPVAAGIGRVVSPAASRPGSPVGLLQSEGVQLTPGQALGGIAQTAEDKLMSAPILGDAIRAARIRGNESLNRAIYRRVLEPIGESTDKMGRAAVADARQKIGAAYDNALSGVKLVPDAQLLADVGAITQRVGGMTPTEVQSLQSIVNRDVIEPLAGVQSIDGRAFKDIESQLSQNITRYSGSPDAHQKEVGDALGSVLDSLRGALARQNPQQASALTAANTAYANLVRLENAAAKQGAHDGVFNAPQLANAVRQSDRSLRKRAYARGDALLQDLSDAAQSRMTGVIPDSGTPGRLLWNAGFLGAGMYNPALTIGGLLAASAPYLPGVSRFSTGLLSARPVGSEAAAGLLRRAPVGLLGGEAAR